MTLLAPTLEAFFCERLMTQRQASPHTLSGYRDTMRLLLCFAAEHTGKPPSRLEVSDLDVRLISAFLDHLEHERHNTASTRNVRLAAIRSLYRFAALRHPEHADVIARVLAIPAKRFDRALINYLTIDEVKALLAAPDRSTPIGRRDHALILTAIQTGLRVSELTGLRCQDVHLGTTMIPWSGSGSTTSTSIRSTARTTRHRSKKRWRRSTTSSVPERLATSGPRVCTPGSSRKHNSAAAARWP